MMISPSANNQVINLAATMVGVGLISILGFITWAIIFQELPKANESAFLVLVGVVSNNVSLVVGFFFGSSANARQQQSTIDTLAKTAQTAGAALTPGDGITLAPGQSATATATDDGTTIKPDPGP